MEPTVLVVEDDPKTAELVRLYLEKDGFRAVLVADGETALALARRRRPDLVVLDLMLPRLDGWSVCRQLRAESRVPIILLTARTTEADTLRGLALGADDYIGKPFSARALADCTTRAWNGPSTSTAANCARRSSPTLRSRATYRRSTAWATVSEGNEEISPQAASPLPEGEGMRRRPPPFHSLRFRLF